MVKRIFAFLIILALLVTSVTGLESVSVYASDVNKKTPGKDKVDPNSEQAQKALSERTEAAKRYYMLEVATGTNAGTNVLYFGIRYRDYDGIERTDFIFPHANALANSYTFAAQQATHATSAEVKRNTMNNNYKVNLPDSTKRDGLQSNTIDDYIFKPAFPMKELIGFDVFMQQTTSTGSANNWTCMGISLYEVSRINDVDMVGYYSSEYFIDFEGILLGYCQGIDPVTQKTVALSLDSNDGDILKQCRIGQRDSWKLVNYEEKSKAPIHELVETYTYKLDFSPSAGAGINGFVQDALNSISVDGSLMNNSTNRSNNRGIGSYKESLTMNIQYTDVGGIVHSVYVPMIMSELCFMNVSEQLGKEIIYGLAQAGDSLAIPITLPGYDDSRKPSIKLYFGTEYATEQCGLLYNSAYSTKTVSENDKISIVGFQVYKNAPNLSVDRSRNVLLVAPGSATPMWYFTSSARSGVEINFDNKGQNAFEMSNRIADYDSGAVLSPKSNGNTFLVEMGISEYDDSETLSDIKLDIEYVSNSGSTEILAGIDVKKAVEEYYGSWSAVRERDTSTQGGAFEITSVPGGTLRFFVTAKNVRKFLSATITVAMDENVDDLQINKFHISMVSDKEGGLPAEGQSVCIFDSSKPNRGNGYMSYWTLSRKLNDSTFAYVTYDNTALCMPGTSTRIEFGATTETVKEELDVDWTLYRYSMTYSDTQQDMGYTKVRNTYTVTVEVAPDSSGFEGDSGSQNQFYFQLLFTNGKTSSYVLANQQLESDGFRSGVEESFKIYCNNDYGEIGAIRIIPDDQQDESDVYDKLKINKVTIAKETCAGIDRTWKCEINDWIGIDYNDSGAKTTVTGQQGRTEAELARSYPVTDKGYSCKLVVEVSTAGYYFEDGRATDPLSGTMGYVLHYTDTTGREKQLSGDVYQAMYEYMNMASDVANKDDKGKNATIDNKTMMCAGKTNYFIINVNEPRSINSIEFKAQGNGKVSNWRIRQVSISRIISGSGGLMRNEAGLIRDYSTVMLACSYFDNPVSLFVPMDRSEQKTTIEFADGEANNIDVNEALGKWNSIVGAEPASKNDKMNIYVHMLNPDSTKRNYNGFNPKNPNDYKIALSLRYSASTSVVAGRDETQTLEGMDHAGYTFYGSTGVSGIIQLKSVTVKATNKSGKLLDHDAGTIADYIIIEQVRDQVIIQTYYIDLKGLDISSLDDNSRIFTDIATSKPDIVGSPVNTELVVMSFGSDTDASYFVRDEATGAYSDIGVALAFKSANSMVDEVLYTPFKFFSNTKDADGNTIDEVKPHQVVKMYFTQDNIKEIIGIRILKQGDVIAELDGLTVYEYETVGKNSSVVDTLSAEAWDAEKITVNGAPALIPVSNEVVRAFATIVFETAPIEECDPGQDDTGTDSPIRSIVSWERVGIETDPKTKQIIYNGNGSEGMIEINDLNDYLQEGCFAQGQTATVKFVMKDYYSLHGVQLAPYDNINYIRSWKLKALTVKVLGRDGIEKTVTRQLNTTITEPDTPADPMYRVNLANISVQASVGYSYGTATDGSDLMYSQTVKCTDSIEDCTFAITAGKSLTVVPKDEGTVSGPVQFVAGSFEDVTVELKKVIATQTGTTTIPADASHMTILTVPDGKSEEGTVINRIVISIPQNITEAETYILTIASIESPSVKLSLLINVLTDNEYLKWIAEQAKEAEEADRAEKERQQQEQQQQQQQQQQEMQQRLEELERQQQEQKRQQEEQQKKQQEEQQKQQEEQQQQEEKKTDSENGEETNPDDAEVISISGDPLFFYPED